MRKTKGNEILTHNELLQKISDLGDNCLGIMAGAVMSDALSAVVRLHFDDYGMCGICSMQDYPCLTIQSIDKELR